MFSSRRADAVGSAADRHILKRTCRNLLGVYNFQLAHTALLKLAAHNLRKRTHLGLVDIRDLELASIQLVTRAHAADDRHILLLRLHDQGNLRCHSIYCIYNIIILFKWKIIRIFRQEEAIVNIHLRIRVDL